MTKNQTQEQIEHEADQSFLSDEKFEQRLLLLLRRNPGLFENWVRQRNRVHGGASWQGVIR
jgi:hypothetical protein